ncbi:MAG: hypothetical protein ACOX52_10100 [Verrucomicrobiota bacterium]
MNCPLGFDFVSGMREGWGIQPSRRQERQGERGEGRGHDLSGAGQGRAGIDPDPDFEPDNDLTDRQPLPGSDALRSVTFQITSSYTAFG